VYVDVGAYTGDTLIRFYAFCSGRYKKIITLEPDKNNFSKMSTLIKAARLDNIELHNIGVWDKKDILVFNTITNIDNFENGNIFRDAELNTGMMHRKKLNTASSKSIGITIPVEKLDTLIHSESVTIIKTNAVAADLQVLQGAEEIIKDHKPAIITDWGSTPGQLLTIPLLLCKFRPDYKFYLRQKYIFNDSKTVLYAV
jgi:FkbM family methyltransferase